MSQQGRVPGIARRPDGRPFVVVHGGAAALGYRNVLAALESALACDADYFEFDVRSTADRQLVIHHDEAIADRPLRALDAAQAERAAAALGYPLPRLDQVLDRAHGRIRLNVELKESGCEAAVLDTLRAHGYGHGDFVITSFEQPALDAVHTLDPAVVTGLLVWDVTGIEALDRFRRSHARFLGPDYAILDDEVLRRAADAGVALMPWTVNEPLAMERLMRVEPVLGVITDEPLEALAARARSASAPAS